MNSKKSAFTLSEVLLTLGVIGVVAAVTIPALMNNISNAQYKTAAKEIVSQIQQAAQQSINDNGGTLPNYSGHLILDIKPYFSVVEYCQGISGCNVSQGDPLYIHWTFLNGVDYAAIPYILAVDGNKDAMLIKDGAVISVGTFIGYTNFGGGGPYTGRNSVIIDVNGAKSPNVFGKDVYVFYVLPTGVLRAYGSYTGDFDPTTDCSSTGTGTSCATLMFQ